MKPPIIKLSIVQTCIHTLAIIIPKFAKVLEMGISSNQQTFDLLALSFSRLNIVIINVYHYNTQFAQVTGPRNIVTHSNCFIDKNTKVEKITLCLFL